MNVVQVRLLEDKNGKRYTYQVPDYIQLAKGDIVRTRNKNNKECIAVCVTNSENLSDNAIDMVMSGNKVISNVTGIYTFNSFDDFENETEKNNEKN